MQIKVGNIPPSETVVIRFSIIQPLEMIINKYWGFTLPSVLTERYAPSSINMNEVPNIKNVGLSASSYKDWKVSVEVKSDKPFTFISNPSHNIQPNLTDIKNGWNSRIYKATWNLTTTPNKNFVVYFKPEKIESPTKILASHPTYPNDTVLLINFVPQLNDFDTFTAEKTLEKGEEGFLELKKLVLKEDIQNARGEFLFVIDRSGSMMGGRIHNLKKALEKFLQILPKDSFFNIVSFGSSYSLYMPESIKYSSSTLKKLIEWIHHIDANMGGTEILSALQAINNIPQIKGYPRNILILTDGDVYNPDQVIRHAHENSDKMRFCSVGIGHGASEYLVKNIAKAGKCISEFVLDNEDIGDKAEYIIKAAISQYLEDIEFHIDCFNEKKENVFHEEDKVGLLLKDETFKKWVFLQNVSGIKECKAKIEYFNSLKNKKYSEELRIDEFEFAEITDIWHKVAYDNKLRDLDLKIKIRDHNSEELKSQIVALSIKYQILSDYTSFLAVLQESTVDSTAEKTKMLIPNLNSADYDSIQIQSEGFKESAGPDFVVRPRHLSFAYKRAGRPSFDSSAQDLADSSAGMEAPKGGRRIQAFQSIQSHDEDVRESKIASSLSLSSIEVASDVALASNKEESVMKYSYGESEDQSWKKFIFMGIGLLILPILILWFANTNKKSKIEIKKQLGVQD